MARPPEARLAVLSRGVNVTNWFRFPASVAPAALRSYLSDAAIADLRAVGFRFVRLPVQPEFLAPSGIVDAGRVALVMEAAARLQRAGLGVVIALHPATWRQERAAMEREALVRIWRTLALAMRPLDAGLTFAEILNEPIFAADASGWAALQRDVLAEIRAIRLDLTVVLSGTPWGGLDGLLALDPVGDNNVVYSLHFYEPSILTTLAAFEPRLDHAALAELPFPVIDVNACTEVARHGATRRTQEVAAYYCAGAWSGGTLIGRIAAAAAWARRHDVAVLVGEFGASEKINAPARLAWLAAARGAFEAAGFGWALWGYDDAMGFFLPRPPGPRPVLDRAVLRALGLREVF